MLFDDNTMLAIFGKTGIDPTGYSVSHNVTLLSQAVQNVRQIVREYHDAATQVRAGNRFTKEGKAQELGALASQMLPRIEGLTRVVAQGKAALEALKAKRFMSPNAIGEGLGIGDP